MLKRLNDYNCYHYKTPIICGISEPRYSKKELAELKKRDEQKFDIGGRKISRYEADQEMRRLETAIREQKGIKTIAQSSGDKIETARCNERIKKYQEKYAEISDITGVEQDKKRMTLTKAVDGDRIKEANEVFRSKSNSVPNNRRVISEKRFNELTIESKKNGAIIVRCEYGDDVFMHLMNNNATASCIGNVLLFRPDPTLSEVLEETYHFMQNINKLNDDRPLVLRTILNEIDAKEFMLKNAKKFKLPRNEIEETKKQLLSYKKQLKDYYKEK